MERVPNGTLATIMEHVADAIVVVDHEGRIDFVNAAACVLFGRRESDLVGEFFGFHIASEEHSEIQIPRSGQIRIGEARTVEVPWNGKQAKLTSIRDVTLERRARELERRLWHADRLSSIGTLAAGIAHEVNNPAMYVSVNVDSLRHAVRELVALVGESPRAQSLASAAEEMLEDCDAGITSISQIARKVSAFARTSDERVESVDIRAVVAAACALVRNQVAHCADVEVQFTHTRLVDADSTELKQVVVNLLINASHAIDARNGSRREIVVTTRDKARGVEISVTDTGCGMQPELIARIFEPFFTTKPGKKGTGLGLYICRETIVRYGGSLFVESEIGVGTTFRIFLPQSARSRPSERRERIASTPTAVPRARLLIIDDDEHILHALRRALRKHHKVTLARGGRDGVGLLESGLRYDAVLCDIMMPDLDGAGVFDVVRKIDADMASRLIFMTGGALTARTQNFVAQTSAPVLSKPIQLAELLSAIANRLGQ